MHQKVEIGSLIKNSILVVGILLLGLILAELVSYVRKENDKTTNYTYITFDGREGEATYCYQKQGKLLCRIADGRVQVQEYHKVVSNGE